jgi:epoxide hydrolase-like predicted phosphatase
MTPIRAIISDFGGVLTSPLLRSFAAFQDSSGIPLEALGVAMARIAHEDGAHPLFELEKGKTTEAAFLARLGEVLTDELGRSVHMHGFSETYFAHLEPNAQMIAAMRSLAGRGLRMALLTNNVREWEPKWRAMLPVDEIFEMVVDSAFVGMRKPDPEIYELTLTGLELTAPECVFVDDIQINCDAARDLGMTAVWFRSNEQAIAEIEAALVDQGTA